MRVFAFRSPLLGIAAMLALTAAGQSGVKVELDEVVDNRMSEGPMTGGLELRVKLSGTDLDRITAARILIKDARDDAGSALGKQSGPDDFMPREYNAGSINVTLPSPKRTATSARIKGAVELFVPARDPSAVVKIDKALAKLDAPLSSKQLKAAKVSITPLSPAGYTALMKARKVTPEDIEKIRARGKAEGVPEKEIELVIGLAQAFESMDADPPEGSILLSGKESDFDRVFRVDVLGADGKPVDMTTRSTSTRGEDSIMTLQPSQPLPENASMQITLLTDKARMSVPFELNVPLPCRGHRNDENTHALRTHPSRDPDPRSVREARRRDGDARERPSYDGKLRAPHHQTRAAEDPGDRRRGLARSHQLRRR
jgi:hypothetical protein